MIRQLLVTIALSGSLSASAQVAVSGDWVTLGDVAPVTGDAASILVAPTPPAGEQLALDPVFLAAVAKKSGVLISLPPDSPVWVTRAGAPTPPTAPVARNAPQANAAASPRSSAGLVLDGAPHPDWILVIANPLSRGAVISEGDLKWAPPTGARGSLRNAATDPAEVVGMELKRSLRADALIQVSDLTPPAVIRKGDTVQLVYASPGVRLTASGLAQQDAGRGEPVRILNQYTKRTIEAVAFAEGEARVGMR